MELDLPTPEDILEELTDKVAAQIERLAPVAFDNALKELTAYHRFLFAINATHTPDGSPVSLAVVAGDGWHPPYATWTMHYERLFERATNVLPQSSHFIYSLSFLPRMLFPGRNAPQLPATVIKNILGLVPSMMRQIEVWITRRRILEAPMEVSTVRQFSLAGSDVNAYTNILPRIIGAWEGLLTDAESMYELREGNEQDEDKRWSILRQIWPIFWQHLSDTAYCLAIAAWNEDEWGTNHFREALVRWPQNLQHGLQDCAELRHRRLLYPSILALDWTAAMAQVSSLSFEYMSPPTADEIFASIIRGVHDDVVLMTASLLLFWTATKKHASDIGARTALSLLLRDADHADHRRRRVSQLRFRSLFLDLVRLKMAGERFQTDSYAAELDGLIAQLDRMTERRIVPGTCLHSFHDSRKA